MRILLLNPNTSASVTALLADRVAAVTGDAATFVPVTARFGAAYIASRAALAIAGHAALDAYAEHGRAAERSSWPASAIRVCWRCARFPPFPS